MHHTGHFLRTPETPKTPKAPFMTSIFNIILSLNGPAETSFHGGVVLLRCRTEEFLLLSQKLFLR